MLVLVIVFARARGDLSSGGSASGGNGSSSSSSYGSFSNPSDYESLFICMLLCYTFSNFPMIIKKQKIKKINMMHWMILIILIEIIKN